jgi:glutamyl-tRNA reductase
MNAPSPLAPFGVIGFDHRRLPSRWRGVVAFDDGWCAPLARHLRAAGAVDGVVFLSTCNRQEVVVSAQHPSFALELIRSELHTRLASAGAEHLPEPYRHVGGDAVRHVLKVGASLDSLVVGERQISGQLRRAFDGARREGWLDKPLNGLARAAVTTARRVHAKASLGGGAVGVFALARDLLKQELAGLVHARIAVIGLGEIGLKTARQLAGLPGVELTLCSRRPRTAAELGETLKARPFVTLEALPGLLATMDAVVLATGSSTPLIDGADIDAARGLRTRPLVVVDLGIPPQAAGAVASSTSARLFNLDWFAETGFGLRPHAREELAKAQDVVDEGVRALAAWTSVRRHSGLFASLGSMTEGHKQRGIAAALAGLEGLSDGQRARVRSAMHDLLSGFAGEVFDAVAAGLSAGHEDGHE